MVRLEGHVLGVLKEAKVLPPRRESLAKAITITVVLNRADRRGYQQYARENRQRLVKLGQPLLSPAEVLARYGPTADAYARLSRYLSGAGLKLLAGSANRLTLTFRGTRAQVEKAFNVHLRDYALRGREFFANEDAPSLPSALSPHVAAVWGLTSYARLMRLLAPAPFSSAIANAYGVGAIVPDRSVASPVTGANQVIALPQDGDFYQDQDLIAWLALTAQPPSPKTIAPSVLSRVHQFTPQGFSPPSSQIGPLGEAMLDVETAVGIAPGATSFEVYESAEEMPLFIGILNYAMANLQGGEAKIVSLSYGACESNFTDAEMDSFEMIVEAATTVHGVSIFASSGDAGNLCDNGCGFDCFKAGTTFPASAPSVIAVGGTALEVDAAGKYQSERWWTSAPDSFGFAHGGGFGLSAHFARPSYQDGFNASPMRSIPDVSADAAPASGILVCNKGCGGPLTGGTSLASPLWAGIWALVAEAAGQPRFVATHELLYSLHDVGFHKPADMTPPSDFAHLGLGTPLVTGLVPPCGNHNQPCCNGRNCQSGLFCEAHGFSSPGPVCVVKCGHVNEPCCHSVANDPASHDGSNGGWCYGGTGASCLGDTCVCGGKGQACCQPRASCKAGLTCSNQVCEAPGPGPTCPQCATNLELCLKGCKTDPAHQAHCDCLCNVTACDCKKGCGLICTPPSCVGL
jgi:kumamolisin